MGIENKITAAAIDIIEKESGQSVPADRIVLQKTRKDVEGDLTIVVFPFVKMLRRSPEQCADMLGNAITEKVEEVAAYNVVKGFLNLTLEKSVWVNFLRDNADDLLFGLKPAAGREDISPVVVEYSSPNTNKPLHLGHIRNNFLGYSVARILEAAGKKVVSVNLVNDRGIHICKSMLAWMNYGNGETPESAGKKGDKLVGDYYVKFEMKLREEVAHIMKEKGIGEDQARKEASLMQEAQELLRRWEERDPDVVRVWKMMNDWVYDGFEQTYHRMGIHFDKIYYESDTYLLGRDIVLDGVKRDKLVKKEDGSVWADLADQKLDEKLLLRADGTSVYMTQDIGTARLRYDDFNPEKMIYVVGNEQNYHFDVLKKVLKKLDEPFADAILHLSYGMVELPDGRMKSREGTVVDADDLMDDMFETARKTTEDLGKTLDFTTEEKQDLYHKIAMGALKYFILKVDPKKNMLFNPDESIDFNGNTGPFIQYTYARISSIMRKAGKERLGRMELSLDASMLNAKEVALLKNVSGFEQTLTEAAADYSPAQIANYAYELCKEFNQFYHEHSVLNEPDMALSDFRLQLVKLISHAIKNSMALLGIDVPEKM
jgi:arginyl-tRNA synthetase